MPRSTIVVGNGLGMALDSEFFKLDNAMDEVWSQPDCLTSVQKDQIKQCINIHGVDDRPHSEEHLDTLHIAVMSCKFLHGISSSNVVWLSTEGQNFPFAIEKFITSTAWYFHHYPGALPQSFLQPLADYLIKTETHIATLNYDNLLYRSLYNMGVLYRYDSALVDGFYSPEKGGFSANNLERKYKNTFGYYLHLHGSPLFIDQNGVTVKQSLSAPNESISTQHLVLTHVNHKTSVIESSPLLSAYWQYFNSGLIESEKIILFGYSGYDLHLNQKIKENLLGITEEGFGVKKVVVVEWEGAGPEKKRQAFWQETLNLEKIKLIRMSNILDFQDWDNV